MTHVNKDMPSATELCRTNCERSNDIKEFDLIRMSVSKCFSNSTLIKLLPSEHKVETQI